MRLISVPGPFGSPEPPLATLRLDPRGDSPQRKRLRERATNRRGLWRRYNITLGAVPSAVALVRSTRVNETLATPTSRSNLPSRSLQRGRVVTLKTRATPLQGLQARTVKVNTCVATCFILPLPRLAMKAKG